MATTERTYANVAILLLAISIVLCGILSPIASWVVALTASCMYFFAAGFFLLTLVEYQDRKKDATAIEKAMNPFVTGLNACSVLILAQAVIVLFSWILIVPSVIIVVYTFVFRKVKRFDATRVWQDKDAAMRDGQVLLGLSGLHFVACLVAMILGLIGLVNTK